MTIACALHSLGRVCGALVFTVLDTITVTIVLSNLARAHVSRLGKGCLGRVIGTRINAVLLKITIRVIFSLLATAITF
jgi:hypothetical protein